MNIWTLVRRSFAFHARAHFGVALGAAIGVAALVGALVVGDSVRDSLHDLALERLGRTAFALDANDRFFRAQLARDMGASNLVPVLKLPATAASVDGSARANQVQALGVDPQFWKLGNFPGFDGPIPPDGVVLNEALAAQLRASKGGTILLRVQKPSLLSRDVPISPQEDYVIASRLKVIAVVPDEDLGRFSLRASQAAPFNAFVSLSAMQQVVGQTNQANLLLSGEESNSITALAASLKQHWQLADAELELHTLTNGTVELRTPRIFIDPPVAATALGIGKSVQPLITYFVNELRDGSNATPYSMVTAIGAPIVPAGMRDDEILLNDWLADDLQAKPGDTISITYYVLGTSRALEEKHAEFHVHGVIPMTGDAADRTLMPEFPGIAKAESSHDWDAGFPIQMNKIRPKDEKYWKDFRGTPKAFITLAAGKKIWSNRFGDYTAIRFSQPDANEEDIRKSILSNLDPASIGLAFQPVREQALAAVSQSVDFGGLFLGFSFFLIIAALILMSLLFRFGLESRAEELGTLLALGFKPRQVRRLLLFEGALLSLVGGMVGTFAGVYYAQAMLHGLTTVWRDAVQTSSLRFHLEPLTLIYGLFGGVIVSLVTIWLTLRRQGRRPARELLEEGAELEFESASARIRKRSFGMWIGIVSTLCALGMIGSALAKHDTSNAETFFSAGSLLLIGGLGFSAGWLARLARKQTSAHMTISALGLRGAARRRNRSLATLGLLACGCFLIIAVGAFRLDANADATKRSSGTGGFALIGESTLPVSQDLNRPAGRDFYSLQPSEFAGVDVVSFRVRDGDDASCLNLNHAQRPRVLGVSPEALQQRDAFTFAEIAPGLPHEKPWLLLKNQSGDEVPAIADENSILWALGKKVGDTLDYTDDQGRTFKIKLVAAIANSILQGSLIIDEAEFVRRFSGESGYRFFLIDAPAADAGKVSGTLTRALRDVGLELTSAAERLNAFNAVQNTYLGTFQTLGGLGLLLGSAGLGIVVLRNVRERRGELALLSAVGFRRPTVLWLVLSEHSALLAAGLAVGLIAAAIAVLPALLSPGSQIPFASLALTLAAVVVNGLVWTFFAARFALRGRLLSALRNE